MVWCSGCRPGANLSSCSRWKALGHLNLKSEGTQELGFRSVSLLCMTPTDSGRGPLPTGKTNCAVRTCGGSTFEECVRSAVEIQGVMKLSAPGLEPGTYGLKVRCSTN